MLKIVHNNKEQVGGFRSLEIILLKDVIFCPPILTNANAAEFLYYQFFETDVSIQPVNETIYMIAKPRESASGTLYRMDAGFEVNYLDKAVEDVFEEYHNQKVIVKGNTFNDQSIIYGSVEFPLKFYYESDHSKKFENPTKYTVSCKADISQKPVIV